MHRFRNCIISFAMVALAYGLAGCAGSPVSPVEPYAGQAPKLQTLYVIASGWHTEIGVPANALTGALASLRNASPHARYFIFGWGQRDYYMAPHPGLGDLFEAAMPGPSVVLVIPLDESPTTFFIAGSSVFTIHVSQEGLDRLSQFVWDYIEKDPQHLPRRLDDGPYPGSAFYASNGTYSLSNTCNRWTAEALRVSGLPVTASGVVFADQVVGQLGRLTE